MAIAHEAVKFMEWKRARVSKKRQVTIPQKFYEQAGIKDEIEFGIQGNRIIIRPVREDTGNDYFADLILADLIKEGFNGDRLLHEFRERQKKMRQAIRKIKEEAEEAARNFNESDNDETEVLFGDVMRD